MKTLGREYGVRGNPKPLIRWERQADGSYIGNDGAYVIRPGAGEWTTFWRHTATAGGAATLADAKRKAELALRADMRLSPADVARWPAARARRANPTAVQWESGPLQDGDDTVTVRAVMSGKGYYYVETQPAGHRYPRGVEEHATRAAAIAAAKRRAQRLARRPNPMLAILNPLPAHLEAFAKRQRLTADERREFNEAIARYCEFHDVEPKDVRIEAWGEVEGEGTRFLVGLGKAEDVSYSVNTKGRFRGSNKKGTPFRHVIESDSTVLAATPDGEMTIILNKPGAKKRMVVRDWLRG